MNIVVLDGYALNPGDLSWSALEALGTVRVFDRTPSHLTVERALGAEIVLTNKTVLGRAEIQALPALRYIGVLATGYNVVDVECATECNVVVTNVPAYSTESVAQAVFALILEFSNQVALHTESVSQGEWTAALDFSYWKAPLTELSGKTLGIIGLGTIGRAVARIGRAFGMRVVAAVRTIPSSLPEGVEIVSPEEVFRQSDVLSLHCPLTEQTERMVNAERLSWMKPTAFLVNTSRGGVVDPQALADALNEGRIAGAGLDVMDREPPAADDPLLSARNLHITPHIAWATRESRTRLLETGIENVRAFLADSAQNVVRG
ncbi:MAG: D-2-hydroxyacid dehydrogenase [Lentisphaeria bacterium]|nr:D-2-hydroxyacid dehydrogenase [Lentisphaeria bacterium]